MTKDFDTEVLFNYCCHTFSVLSVKFVEYEQKIKLIVSKMKLSGEKWVMVMEPMWPMLTKDMTCTNPGMVL